MCQRVLSESDPEPAVGSVVLDRYGAAWQRHMDGKWWISTHDKEPHGIEWATLLSLGGLGGCVTLLWIDPHDHALIHDGGQA